MTVAPSRTDSLATTVLHVGGLQYASEKAVVERVLGRRPGVVAVEANPVAQTATVEFDPAETSVEELAKWVGECGHHCAGPPCPGHRSAPLATPAPAAPAADSVGAGVAPVHGISGSEPVPVIGLGPSPRVRRSS